ncbi:MAG: DUF4249 family protein [Calditrichae bacterium]|nr:DUF4249 family protein [Calditrichota bacterium]MCB9057707.1 DUF4249 family protein [Calditrichia bacterium]
MKKTLTLLISFWVILSCGEGVVEVENKSYEPKISVEGFLIPGKKVSKIYVYKNFRLDADLRQIPFAPDPSKTTVSLTDEQTGNSYNLSLNIPDSLLDINGYYFKYDGEDLMIENDKSYSLEVNMEVDGRQLWTKSTTTVPPKGFSIKDINFDELQFAGLKDNGDYELFELTIQRAPGVSFYVSTIRALKTDYDHFIKNHIIGELDKKLYDEEFERFTYDTNWIQNTPLYPGESTIRLYWFDFYFYSDYEVIVYAADKNYKEFLQTFNRTQEFDGNFHEAKFNFEGDGIGVFGSVVPDTIYVRVTE